MGQYSSLYSQEKNPKRGLADSYRLSPQRVNIARPWRRRKWDMAENGGPLSVLTLREWRCLGNDGCQRQRRLHSRTPVTYPMVGDPLSPRGIAVGALDYFVSQGILRQLGETSLASGASSSVRSSSPSRSDGSEPLQAIWEGMKCWKIPCCNTSKTTIISIQRKALH
jgi:hypothetical protein